MRPGKRRSRRDAEPPRQALGGAPGGDFNFLGLMHGDACTFVTPHTGFAN